MNGDLAELLKAAETAGVRNAEGVLETMKKMEESCTIISATFRQSFATEEVSVYAKDLDRFITAPSRKEKFDEK